MGIKSRYIWLKVRLKFNRNMDAIYTADNAGKFAHYVQLE